MRNIFKFGEDVTGYSVPVLNEREIRGGAGMLFLMMVSTIMVSGVTGDYSSLKFAVIIFMMDLLIRLLINPRFSPFLVVARWIVRNQTPEYVGAKQKKFAWSIGIVLTVAMVIMMNAFNYFGPVTSLVCMVCLAFLFFETAFGICLGCFVYRLVYREKAQYCPGEVCDVKEKHDIQKTTFAQWMTVVAFAGAMAALGIAI